MPIEEEWSHWESVRVDSVENGGVGAFSFLSELSKVYAGGAVVWKTFEIRSHPFIEDCFSRNCLFPMGFFSEFWKRPSVKLELPWKTRLPDPQRCGNFTMGQEPFEWDHPLRLGGDFAATLSNGGAHGGVRNDLLARRAGEEFAHHLIDDDFENTLAFKARGHWSDFFYDMPCWDLTWVVVKPQVRRVNVILATEFD